MNKDRRKQLTKIAADISELGVLTDDLKERLQTVLDEEQEAFDNLPEGFQSADRGEQMQSAIDVMEGAVNELSEIDLEGIALSILSICER